MLSGLDEVLSGLDEVLSGPDEVLSGLDEVLSGREVSQGRAKRTRGVYYSTSSFVNSWCQELGSLPVA